MGLLLLLTSTLLLSWTAPNTAVKITKVDLSIEPSATVNRSTDVILRCKAEVLTSGSEARNRVYTIYKDESVIYNKTTSSSEDLLYKLPQARVSNNGKYKCHVIISGERKASEAATLTVKGMSTPILHLNKSNITEGEPVTASCFAPGETGSLLFSFYDGSKEINDVPVTSSPLEFFPKGVGVHNVHCSYSVFIMPNLFKSQRSNTLTVTVKELSLEPVLEIFPKYNVYEGDALNISCSVSDSVEGYEAPELYLSQGTELIKNGKTSIHVSWTAHARDPELTIECRLYVGSVAKVVKETVSVTELFSVPTLRMSALEVFQMEKIELICKSQESSNSKLEGEPLIYSLEPNEYTQMGNSGVFTGHAKTINSNYTCTAAAKGIRKTSNVLAIQPKVRVSVPKIWVSDIPVLGKQVDIFCLSETGTPPITYTLWRSDEQQKSATVREFRQPATFPVDVRESGELNEYQCRASNSDKMSQPSDILQTAVIEPMTEAHLMVLPITGDISEGNSVTLICSFKGSPPVTVQWFRDADPKPLANTTTNINTTNYPFMLSKKHSDKYYCRAKNRASSVESNRVNLVVGMAMWKKLLIPGIIILVVSSLVMVGSVLFIRSRRDAASFCDDKEGRVTNGTRGSVASLPADVSNRSSCSIPATV